MSRGGWPTALALVLTACATSAAPPAPAPAPPAALALADCRVRSVEARCGRLEVFENRAARAGRKIPISVVYRWLVRAALRPHHGPRPARPIRRDAAARSRALGYSTINLYGISYGSLAALQCLRQDPPRVRSLALSGVATPAQKLPLHFAGGAQIALDRLLADCAADAACHGAFPDLAGDLAAVLTRFDAGPITFDVPAVAGRAAERVSMPRAQFVERIRLMLYHVRAASRVPLVLDRAARGDWGPFARATSPTLTGAGAALALGMYLSVTCSESIPVITEEDIARETRGRFVDAERTRLHVRACREWPRGEIPAASYTPVVFDVPVLMLSGELDAATPPHYATEAARTLPNARQVLIRNVAHDYVADGLRDLVADVFA